ncbi:MAG: DUF262 domain-containing HNH endonuclease family protein [Bryobacterales bacterium]|nr:DUF262 domain-containing HNH endonuclease family protein [Bryobacterales bacterium]
MSNTIDIQQFLVGKTFIIPLYQRDYAWTTIQVEDLLEDIAEAIETSSPHYLGTVVLSHGEPGSFEIVDGQQRLSTLTLLIHALLEELSTEDQQRIADTAILLKRGSELKLNFGKNSSFVRNLFSGSNTTPETAGQRKLRDAHKYARERAKMLSEKGGRDLIVKWMGTIKTLEIIQFDAKDTGRAIRMFQTINDRGLPLSTMDKAKALLVFYSNRHLSGELDSNINNYFGQCFDAFDGMREFVRKPAFLINNIARDTFGEDDLLRYHYLSYSFPDIADGGDYYGSTQTVFDSFLRGTLKQFSKSSPEKLRDFIEDYTQDLSSFCNAFQRVISTAETNPRLYKCLVVLGISARLYPLLIRLYQRGMLFETQPDSETDLLQCLETCDVRVYKTRATDPAKDIGDLSHGSRHASTQKISKDLRSFTESFMPDGYFHTLLEQDMYDNRALTLIMLEYDEYRANAKHNIETLRGLVSQQITREHILPQTPSFAVTECGFDNDDDYKAHLHKLGNMTPLTKRENSRCNDASVYTKMTDKNFYSSSHYVSTRLLAHEYKAGSKQFQKEDLQQRTQTLAEWVQQRWPLW